MRSPELVRSGRVKLGYRTANGIRLHVARAGPGDGKLVLLLHGFPEFWYGWRYQIGPLAEAGFRVLAPDQRGYNLSDKPSGAAAYRLDDLAADVIGLIDAAGRERAFLAGHDWGGIVAWWVAMHRPDRVERLAVINAPHPGVMAGTLLRSPQQTRMSAYVAYFQLPWLPEALLRRRHWRALTGVLKSSSLPGTFSRDDLQLYREAWDRTGAMTAMLNWYRAAFRFRPRLPKTPVKRPTLVVWGEQDRFLSRRLAEASAALCPNSLLRLDPDTTHWIHHESPRKIAAWLLDFFQ